MRKFLLLCLFCSFAFFSKATTFDVSVANFQFSPANIPNVVVGDIVRFTWANGSHTTTCDPGAASGTSLPAGAPTWNQQMNSAHTTFSYTVTTPGNYSYVCIPHSPNMAGTFTASAALPVILTSFNITNVENKAVINWKTSSEQNSSYFSVRKSSSGKDFKEIAKVPASGISSTDKTYSYTDINPIDGNAKFVYYLLGIIDKDGKSNFSGTEIFKSKTASNKIVLSMTPNPVAKGGHLMINFNAEDNEKLQVQVTNIEGKTVIETVMDAHKGVNMGHLHLGDLSSGTYSVRFILKGQTESYIFLLK